MWTCGAACAGLCTLDTAQQAGTGRFVRFSVDDMVLLAGILLLEPFPQLLFAGIILFAMTTLFSFITLPVEIDASKRALVWLSASGITNSYNHRQAEDALRSAAYTYVVAALGSLATLIYYIMIFMGRRE